jgi:alpha-amylase
MPKLKFIFGVHNHQPVGNFDFVFQEAYQKAYLPFLEMVAQYPWFRFTMHNSGCLWEWLEANHPEYLDKVKVLVKSGQVELMGGGFYEPVLPAIPEDDRRGQLEMMSGYLKDRFGETPAGAWVAERVWEPCLASTLAGAGIKYTVLDDYHFKCAGKQEKDLGGYYLTDDQGQTLSVFPISQKLRYLIPFHDVDEVMAYLRELYDANNKALAILADDGEKFGIWPGTYDHVYTKGWLERFLEKLSQNLDWIELSTFSEALKETSPLGRIYLPTGSYAEMGQWVLEPESEVIYRELADRLKNDGSYQRYSPFVRGGIWRNYLVKYPESNNIYRKMLHISGKAAGSGDDIKRELYRGQCNCAYWHGIFGGLYLPHLREALYRHLIRAENLANKERPPEYPTVERKDFDGDGHQEILLSNDKMNLYLSPEQGGTIFEWDLKEKEINLFDTLARRPENYHRQIADIGHGDQGQGKSIHETLTAKEQGLEKLLHYDRFRRVGSVDHLFVEGTTLEEFIACAHKETDQTLGSKWEAGTSQEGELIKVELAKISGDLQISKTISLGADGSFGVHYRWTNNGKAGLDIWPGVEFNFGLLSSGPGRHCSSPDPLTTERLDQPASDNAISRLTVHDQHRKMEIVLSLSRPADLWRFPVETVSQSESGLERNYQCSCFLWHAKLRLEPGEGYNLNFEVGYKGV